MKKAIITFCVIVILLFSYCVFEQIYLGRFSAQMGTILSEIERETASSKLQASFKSLTQFLEEHKFVLEQISPRAEIEQLYISLGHMEAYLQAEQITEIRVSAAEMQKIVNDICDPPIL